MRGLLTEIGYAGALLARELPDGKLMLIDGHLRAETTPKSMVPVLVLDVTEDEADKILLTFDPVSAMAQADKAAMELLLSTVRTESKAVAAMLERTAGESAWTIVDETWLPKEIDQVPDLPKEPKTRLGDIWTLGRHKLMCGNAVDSVDVSRLLGESQVDLVGGSDRFRPSRERHTTKLIASRLEGAANTAGLLTPFKSLLRRNAYIGSLPPSGD